MKSWVGDDEQTHKGQLVGHANGYDIVACDICGFKHAIPLPKIEGLVLAYS